MCMFDFLKTASRVFVVLAIVCTILLIPVFIYLHDYQLEFSLNKHPIVMLCVLGLLILQPISFAMLAGITRVLEKKLFRYDLKIHKKIKDVESKQS